MTEETNETLTNTEETTTTTQETDTTEETTTPGGLTDGLTAPETKSGIPEGLDSELFDEETMTLKQPQVIERLNSLKEQVASYKKQANDMRKKLSKGVDSPDKIEDYKTGYKYDDKYSFLSDDAESLPSKHINGVLDTLNDFAFEHGLSLETAKDLKDLYLKYAEDVQIIDTRTPEEKERDRANFIHEQKAMLGDEADEIIKDNLKFFKEYAIFNEEEKKELLQAMDKSAAWNSIGYKIRKLFGQSTSADIPVRGVMLNGLADDHTLAKEYYDSATSDSRRWEILQQRANAGRTSKLPMPD